MPFFRCECNYAGTCINYDDEVCTKTPSKSSFVGDKPRCYGLIAEVKSAKGLMDQEPASGGLLKVIFQVMSID